eukprot:7312330-Lingulodinium_polyedra.AAC.1
MQSPGKLNPPQRQHASCPVFKSKRCYHLDTPTATTLACNTFSVSATTLLSPGPLNRWSAALG